MPTHVLTSNGKPSYASFWPSIAEASAQLSQRRFPRAGRVPSGNPAVSGPASPSFVGAQRRSLQKGGV